MKKIIGILAMLLMVSSVSANLCDDAIDEGLYQDGNLIMDLNGDGILTISDVAILSTNRNNDSWCNMIFYDYFNPEPADNGVDSSPSFKKYNLDKKNKVEMSRNVFGGVAREIQYNDVRYKVGVLWNTVWLVNKETRERVNTPEGLNIEVEPRTFFTRTIVFTRS